MSLDRGRGLFVELGLRFVLCVVLLAFALLKFRSETLGFWETTAALVEAAVGLRLLLARSYPRVTVALLAVYLFATLGVGMWRARGVAGLEGECRCLGDLVPLAIWQQMVLSSVLLVAVGVLGIVAHGRHESRVEATARS